MKSLFVATALIAAVAFAVLTWWPAARAPFLPPSPAPAVVQQPPASPPDSPPSIPEPGSYVQQQAPPQVAMPDGPITADQGSTRAPVPLTQSHHRRIRRADTKEGAQVDRSVANGFTADLNRQELQSLRSGVIAPNAPWRGLYPPR